MTYHYTQRLVHLSPLIRNKLIFADDEIFAATETHTCQGPESKALKNSQLLMGQLCPTLSSHGSGNIVEDGVEGF